MATHYGISFKIYRYDSRGKRVEMEFREAENNVKIAMRIAQERLKKIMEHDGK